MQHERYRELRRVVANLPPVVPVNANLRRLLTGGDLADAQTAPSVLRTLARADENMAFVKYLHSSASTPAHVRAPQPAPDTTAAMLRAAVGQCRDALAPKLTHLRFDTTAHDVTTTGYLPVIVSEK